MSNDLYEVEIYPLAELDLEDIFQYYYEASCELSVANHVAAELKSAILGLAHMPKSHPKAREIRLRQMGVRKLIAGKYILPFLIDEDKKVVFVIRVFHGSMNYQKYL